MQRTLDLPDDLAQRLDTYLAQSLKLFGVKLLGNLEAKKVLK